MSEFKVKPCPLCGKTEYRYAATWGHLLSETALALPSLMSQGVSAKAIGRIVATAGSGLGFFSAPKMFFQEIIQGIESTPLLVCSHCKRNVIMCPKCSAFLLLESCPGMAELIDCPKCKARFGHCERSDDFDSCGVTD